MTFHNINTIMTIDIVIAVLILFLLIWRFKNRHNMRAKSSADIASATIITSKDIRAIAGDDVMVTQLDLARAYIELGKKKLAKQILDHVLKHGNPPQQQAARQLMASI